MEERLPAGSARRSTEIGEGAAKGEEEKRNPAEEWAPASHARRGTRTGSPSDIPSTHTLPDQAPRSNCLCSRVPPHAWPRRRRSVCFAGERADRPEGSDKGKRHFAKRRRTHSVARFRPRPPPPSARLGLRRSATSRAIFIAPLSRAERRTCDEARRKSER